MEMPWNECKVAYDINSVSEFWDSLQAGDMELPEGWSAVGTDSSGARVVAIFQVDGIPTVKDGKIIAREIKRLKL